MNTKLKILTGLFLILYFGNGVFSQTRVLQWKTSTVNKGHNFPTAFISGSTLVEENINKYLQEKYINQTESYRDNFYEYNGFTINPNICGVSLEYEHEFNTAPGVWTFTDINYFDLRNGKNIGLQNLILENRMNDFLEIVNVHKNEFVCNFISNQPKENDRLSEIANYTLEKTISKNDIFSSKEPSAMSTNYELKLFSNHLTLSYHWEYGWGLGENDLPNIDLKFTFEELLPYLNDYAKSLLLVKSVIPQNKLFYGYIAGKYKISALTREVNDSIKITYWYESNKAPINWIGTISNEKFVLTEKESDSNKNRAEIELMFYYLGDKVMGIGNWIDKTKDKTLTIELFEE
jgi:hypothetical protein